MSLTDKQKEAIEDTRDLVSTGDTKLSPANLAFKVKTGQHHRLTDEQLLECHASQNDDYGTEDIVRRMLALTNGKPLNWDGEQIDY